VDYVAKIVTLDVVGNFIKEKCSNFGADDVARLVLVLCCFKGYCKIRLTTRLELFYVWEVKFGKACSESF